jgi:hypothetical protein
VGPSARHFHALGFLDAMAEFAAEPEGRTRAVLSAL